MVQYWYEMKSFYSVPHMFAVPILLVKGLDAASSFQRLSIGFTVETSSKEKRREVKGRKGVRGRGWWVEAILR